jgi:hypothetical protein
MNPDPLESALCQGDHHCGPLLELRRHFKHSQYQQLHLTARSMRVLSCFLVSNHRTKARRAAIADSTRRSVSRLQIFSVKHPTSSLYCYCVSAVKKKAEHGFDPDSAPNERRRREKVDWTLASQSSASTSTKRTNWDTMDVWITFSVKGVRDIAALPLLLFNAKVIPCSG